MHTPAISVLLPVYNGARFVDEALASIVRQTEQDFEVIVVDDASTDATPSILSRWAEGDARIRILRNEKNHGVAASLNRGLRECSAPLIARADADDVQFQRRFAAQRALLSQHPDVGVVGGTVEFIDEQGLRMLTPSPRMATADRDIRFQMLTKCPFWHTVVMFRRDLALAAGGYSEAFRSGPEDYDLWERLSWVTHFANIQEVFASVRIHRGSVTKEWSSDGYRLYSSVAARAMTKYLCRDVALQDAHAALNLFGWMRSTDLDNAALCAGTALLREILAKAREKESRPVTRLFRESVSRALLMHSVALSYRGRPLSRRLFIEGIRWSPATLVSLAGAGLALKLILPASLHRALGALRGRRPASDAHDRAEQAAGRSGA